MLHLVWIGVCISLISSSQGFKGLDAPLNSLLRLEEEIEQQISGVKLLIDNGFERITEEHDYESKKAVAVSEHSTNEILKEAEKRGCSSEQLDAIRNAGYNLQDRWSECMNLTQKLVDYENLTLALYNDYLLWRPTFCDAVNNVSLCMNLSFTKKVTCAYDGVVSYYHEFQNIRLEMTNLVHYIHKLFLKTIEDFKGCFGSQQSNVFREQQEILDTKCPRRTAKYLSFGL